MVSQCIIISTCPHHVCRLKDGCEATEDDLRALFQSQVVDRYLLNKVWSYYWYQKWNIFNFPCLLIKKCASSSFVIKICTDTWKLYQVKCSVQMKNLTPYTFILFQLKENSRPDFYFIFDKFPRTGARKKVHTGLVFYSFIILILCNQ